MLKNFLNNRKAFKKLKREIEAKNLEVVLDQNNIDLFIDVGANVGQTGISLRKQGYRGRIISFEPLPQCHDALLKVSNSDTKWIIFDQCAIGNYSGEIEIAVSAASDLSSILPPTAELSKALPKVYATEHITVPIRRLDEIISDDVESASAPFLKIDAQGHDMAVLQGALGVMDKLHGIQVEMSLFQLYQGETLYLEILNFLKEQGFEPHLLVERTFSEKLGRQLQIDGVFFRSK